MSLRQQYAEQFGDDLLFLDPATRYDSCILGVADGCGRGPVVVYDTDKVIASLVEDGLSEEDALDYFGFNIIGAYVGERTPMFLTRLEQ